MCALLSVGVVVSQSEPLYQGAKWPVLFDSGDLVAPQQNGMLDFCLG
jgi:hypothetical protein